MTTASIKYFDTHEYIKHATQLGSSEELAEFQVVTFEHALETAVTSITEQQAKELATKYDVALIRKDMEVLKLELQREIISSRNQMIIWVAGLFLASGMVQHFFK